MIQYLALVALYMALAFVTGMGVGDWTARHDRRAIAARRQTLAQLVAVASAKGHRL